MRSTRHSSHINQVTALIDGLERLERQYGARGVLQGHAIIEQQLILALALLRRHVCRGPS